MAGVQELRRMELQEAKIPLKQNKSMLEMLEGSTPLEDLAKLREEWVEPLEQVIAHIEKGNPR